MEKPKNSIFLRISQRLASIPVLVISSVNVLLVGLLWILFPILDGASEIFFPGYTSYMIELLMVAAVVVLFHITCFIMAVFYRSSIKYLLFMLIPLLLTAVPCHFLYPSDFSRGLRRVDSFQLGARYRVKIAGGDSKVRQEALTLINKTSGESLSRSQWPDSIYALGASNVKVDKEKGIIDVEIPRRRCFFWGDQFGYLITDVNAPEPVITNDPHIPNGHRLWKISDGIYLYEKWP